MNELSLNTAPTMTLKEITDLLEVRHNDAMKTVAKMAKDSSFGYVTEISYRTEKGNFYQTYQLDKRQSIAVSAKLNTTLLMRIIDRWQELEHAKPKTPKTLIEAMQMATQLLIENEAKQLQIDKLKTDLDMEFGYCSILRASIFLGEHESKFDWHVLKPYSIAIGYPPKRVPSPRFGYQLLYPLQAFKICYPQFDFEGLTPDQDTGEVFK